MGPGGAGSSIAQRRTCRARLDRMPPRRGSDHPIAHRSASALAEAHRRSVRLEILPDGPNSRWHRLSESRFTGWFSRLHTNSLALGCPT
jgi:hypothetical protein